MQLRWARAVAGALAGLMAVGVARADGLTLRVQPSFSSSRSTTTTPLDTTTAESLQATERYRLSFDRALYANVRLLSALNYDRAWSWTELDGEPSEGIARDWNGYGSLNLGNTFLGGVLSYNRTQSSDESTTGGFRSKSPRLVREAYSAAANWRPADLPAFSATVRHAWDRDEPRLTLDTVSDEASLAATYAPTRDLQLRASARWLRGDDRLTGTTLEAWEEAAQGTWSRRLFDARTTAEVSYSVSRRDTETLARPGGEIRTPRPPSAALSLVEGFLDAPQRDTLLPNTRLGDGDREVAADPALNLGFSRALAGDLAFRDVGGQFTDLANAVNTISVYVDVALPPAVAGAVSWSAFESDDNQDWTPAAIVGPAEFQELEQRFEITIAPSAARFLKVVARPIPAGVTSDPRFSDVRITEIEFALVVPAESVPASTSVTSGSLSAGARTRLLRSRPFNHNIALFVAHGTDRTTTWSLVNGLAYTHPLRRTLVLGARLERRDEDFGSGHADAHQWGASLTYDPIPTYGAVLSYSGLVSRNVLGTARSQGLAFLNRADIYGGVAASAGATASVGSLEDGRDTANVSTNSSLLLTPNRVTTATLSYELAWSRSSPPGGTSTASRSSRAEAGLSLSPFPALFLSGSVARQETPLAAATLTNLFASFSPFQGGTLLMRYGHNETYDTGTDTRTRTTGPSARWRIRQGWFLDASYNWASSDGPQIDTESQGVFVSLLATIL